MGRAAQVHQVLLRPPWLGTLPFFQTLLPRQNLESNYSLLDRDSWSSDVDLVLLQLLQGLLPHPRAGICIPLLCLNVPPPPLIRSLISKSLCLDGYLILSTIGNDLVAVDDGQGGLQGERPLLSRPVSLFSISFS